MNSSSRTSPASELTPEQALTHSVQADHAPAPAEPPAPRKHTGKTGRSRAREFILQALYQYLVGHNDAAAIDQFTRELTGFHKGDAAHFDAVFHGCVQEAEALDAQIAPHLDRGWKEISPVEHACMWIGVYEFQHFPDVPWRVVINECIELAKAFGGTDGHKYVNGVLNAVAPELRALEVEADRQRS